MRMIRVAVAVAGLLLVVSENRGEAAEPAQSSTSKAQRTFFNKVFSVPATIKQIVGGTSETTENTTKETNAANEEVSSSSFTIGTMTGVSIALSDRGKYRVNDDRTIVQYDKDASVVPAVFALPSWALVDVFNRPLSVILPIGMQGRELGDAAAGLGVSWGDFGKPKTFSVGIAVAWVVSGRPGLTSEQRSAYDNKVPLPNEASTSIDRRFSSQLVVGFYIAPKI